MSPKTKKPESAPESEQPQDLEGLDEQVLVADEEQALMPADFAELEGHGAANGGVPLETLMDLTLPVTIELGRCTMTVQDVLELGRGSVVQLDRLAGEPIDVFVADRRFAEGEVVILGEQFGVRITRILAQAPAEDGRR